MVNQCVSTQVVGNNTRSVWNRGVTVPSGLVDVVAYDATGQTGAGICIRQGRRATLPSNWWDRISSYKWVTRTTCNGYPQV